MYDVLLVMVSGVSVPVEDGRAHPPVAAPRVQLAPRLTLGKLDTRLAELIANACEFRGHFYYSPHRPYGWRYDYVLEQSLEEAHRSRWDQDESIRLALALSRFVRDNADSGQYAARVTEYANGQLRVMPNDCGELRHVYRMSDPHDSTIRDWLDADEARQLAELLAAFHSTGELPPRVRQAFWKLEHAAWEYYADVILPVLTAGLEGLLNEQRPTDQAVRHACAAPRAGVGDRRREPFFCSRIYKARSQGAHGGDIELFQSASRRPAALKMLALLQSVLRTAVLRSIMDTSFRSVFEDDALIRDRWPVERRHGWWRWRRVHI